MLGNTLKVIYDFADVLFMRWPVEVRMLHEQLIQEVQKFSLGVILKAWIKFHCLAPE